MPEALAAIRIVGTRDPNDGSRLWGRDHPSAPDPLREAARLCRRYGERHGRDAPTMRKIACTAAVAWNFAAVARRLRGAEGAYTAEAGAEVLLVYERVTLASVAGDTLPLGRAG